MTASRTRSAMALAGPTRHDRFAAYGLLFTALLFLISGGHLVFLALFSLLPLGGIFGHHRRYGQFSYRGRGRY
jgi:hypothetical protein